MFENTSVKVKILLTRVRLFPTLKILNKLSCCQGNFYFHGSVFEHALSYFSYILSAKLKTQNLSLKDFTNCLFILSSVLYFKETMENAEEIHNFLEEFSKRKPKIIPQELNDYLAYVARTGDPVYQWSLVKCLFKEKLLNVITDFYETTPSIDIPPYPNVDPFNYDVMKNSLLERLDSFTAAPFTVQRICELLTCPRKQYNRIDKFMRAIEKNILVVSTREPGSQRHVEPENGEAMEPIVNGSDNNSECNVDVEMEDVSWKENRVHQQSEPQPSSSDTQISVDDVEARLQAKEETPMETQEKTDQDNSLKYESVTPPEPNTASSDETPSEDKPFMEVEKDEEKPKITNEIEIADVPKSDTEMMEDNSLKDPLSIPEIKVDDAEMTEQRLIAQANQALSEKTEEPLNETEPVIETETKIEETPPAIDENSSDSNSNTKDDVESKVNTEISTSSEESSSSENTDGSSNSPKTDIEPSSDNQEESSQSDKLDSSSQREVAKEEPLAESVKEASEIGCEDYSISDVNSELPQPPAEPVKNKEEETANSNEISSNEIPTEKQENEEKETVLKPEEEKIENADSSLNTVETEAEKSK